MRSSPTRCCDHTNGIDATGRNFALRALLSYTRGVHRYFRQSVLPPAHTTYELTDDLLGVIAADDVPTRLRPLARDLGAGSALSSPDMLLQDLVNLHDTEPELRNVRGPATASLLGGSVSGEGELEAAGVAFGAGCGFLGFLVFVIPSALLIPGGTWWFAYRLFRYSRDVAALRAYARVSRAAPHVATIVAMSDDEVTRDEARLLRDLMRGRVGSPAERQSVLENELSPQAKREFAIDAIRDIDLHPKDWTQLLSIAIATAHADHEFTGDERETIAMLRGLTSFTEEEFEAHAQKAEESYLRRCELGEAMALACYEIACAREDAPPDDALSLLDIVLRAAVPSDEARVEIARIAAASSGQSAVSSDELWAAPRAKRSLFQRVALRPTERQRQARDFANTMALFLAALEQWRGWVVPKCREVLVELGESYGIRPRRLRRSLVGAHRNIERLRRDWIEPLPWDPTAEPQLEVEVKAVPGRPGTYAVTALAAGRFLFQRGNTRWEWRSTAIHFDSFVDEELDLDLDLDQLVVHTDDVTYQLLSVTVEAHAANRRIERA